MTLNVKNVGSVQKAESEKVPRFQNRILRFLDKGVSLLVDGTALVSGIAIILLALALLREIIGRYLFNNPSNWVDEFSGYVAAGVTFLGAAYALRHGALISVTIVSDRIPKRARHFILALGLLISSVVLVIVLQQVTGYVFDAWANDLKANTVLMTPLWIPRLVMLFGLAVLLVETIRQTILEIKSGVAAVQEGEE